MVGGAANAATMANDLGFDILKKTKTKNIFRYTLKTKNKCITFGNRQRNFNLPNFLPKV